MSARLETGRDDTSVFVPETRIGFWFLGTETWTDRVNGSARARVSRTIDSSAARE